MAGEKNMETSLPLDKLKAETLRLICRDLGLPPSTKVEMVTALHDAAVQSAAVQAAAMEGECCLKLVAISQLMVRKHLY
jgi:hypothetical protein